MERWMERWMDGCMDGWMHGCLSYSMVMEIGAPRLEKIGVVFGD